MADSISRNPFEAFSTTGSTLAASEEKLYISNTQNATNLPLFLALSDMKKQEAMEFASNLNHAAYDQVISFGKETQEKLTQFTSVMLKLTHRQDVDVTGQLLNELVSHLEKIDTDALVQKEPSFFSKLFNKRQPSTSEVMAQYTRLKVRIDRLSIQLEHSQLQLLKEFQMLDQLYSLNEEYFHNINTFIAACELKLDQLKTQLLPTAQQKLESSGDPMHEHAVRDLNMQVEWIDKRKYDLEISREIAIQSAPQIRMIQKTGQMLIDKIQSSVMTTIPLWQNQIAMIMQMNQQRRIAQSEQRMVEASEKLARKNQQAYAATKSSATNESAAVKANLERFRETQAKLLRELEDTLLIQQKTSQTLLETEQNFK